MRDEATKPRRTVLRWIAAAPAFVFLLARAADGKAKKADMQYQDKPKDGQLCGTWRRAGSSDTPRTGERFRFVTVSAGGPGGSGSSDGPVTVIYGDVLR